MENERYPMMQRDLQVANIGVGATLDELEEWADEQATLHRAWGYASQMAGASIIAATHIGREFAFQRMVMRIREMREAILTGRDPRD